MTTEVHGHEVMARILAAQRLFTRESLAAFITQEFGPEARFRTCAAAGLTAVELVEFLGARGKFCGSEAGFTVDPHRVCQH